MKIPRSLFLSATLVLFAAFTAPGQAQEKPRDATLTEATYEIWRDHVLPRSWELNFQKIEWRMSFWEAVIEANEQDKPILLWTMNGHPFCNT